MASTETANKAYHANFELDPTGHWLVEIEEIPGVHTFGKTLGKAREYLLDALALWLDVPVESIREQVEFRPPPLPAGIEDWVWKAIAEREIAEVVTQLAGHSMTTASVSLVREAHMSMRDAAVILGISHQRVQQLVAGAPPDASTAPSTEGGEAVEEFTRIACRYLPGGSKEDLGALAELWQSVLRSHGSRCDKQN
jgi:predicted RNase H-like HicB family nuclease